MAEVITLKVARPFLYGGSVRLTGQLVDVDKGTAKDLLKRKSASIPAEDEPAAPPPTPARAARAKRS